MGNEELRTIDLNIYDRTYTVKGEASEEEMRSLARYLDAKITRVAGGTKKPLTIDTMILVAMNTAQDTVRMKEERDEALTKVEKVEKRLADYGVLWNRARDGFRQASTSNEELTELKEELEYEIKRLNREIRDLKKDLRALTKENKVLKERLGEPEQRKEDNLEGQLQMRIPPNL